MTRPSPAPPELAAALHAARLQFALLGVVGGVWGAHIPSLVARFRLDALELSLLLLAGACGAVLAVFRAGPLVARLGPARASAWAAALFGGMLALVLHCEGPALLLPVMLLFGAALSVFDVAINAEGTALESLAGRPVLSQLHGMYSLGGMAGAAACAGLLSAGIAAAPQLLGFGLAAAVLAAMASTRMLARAPRGAERGPAGFVRPRGRLFVIGSLVFAAMLAEGVMYDWSVLYLERELRQPHSTAALGYAVFAGAMAAMRFAGDALRAREREPALLAGGGALAAGAMALALLAARPALALAGFGLAGLGLATAVPILFAAAARQCPPAQRASAIASVSALGYAAFMIGPPLAGALARGVSLSAALALVVLASAWLALGARRIG